MPLYRVEAIVLHSRPFGEADRLVTLLTRERGKHRAVARGARRPRSTLAAGVQPFVRASYLLWRGRSLDGISQCQVLEGFRPLREELERMARAACACELADGLLREDDPQPEVFALLLEGLRLLAGARPEALPRVLLACEWQLLSLGGFRPELEACAQCGAALPPGEAAFSARAGGAVCPGCRAEHTVLLSGAARAALGFLLRQPLAAAPRLRLVPGDLRALEAAADALVEHVLERPLNSRAWLETLDPA